MAERACGILLHATSLPAPDGVPSLGGPARRWLDWLERAGQGLWQILPLGPPDADGSPYGALSAFAGDERLVDLEPLVAAGLVAAPPAAGESERRRALDEARGALGRRSADDPLARAWSTWVTAPEQREWLDDWALFAALRRRHGGASWLDWPRPLRDRQPAALATARAELAEPIERERFAQFLFWTQWRELKREANRRGIRIVGDLPIYAALDSADVWSHRELFELDADGRPAGLAGVPPDAYSEGGQLWGHPLLRWQRLRDTGYAWWVGRLAAVCRSADVVRVDHFRAYAAYWRVEPGAADARGGRWVEGPGGGPFEAARRALGELDLIAEDLGVIDDPVRRLRGELGLPGMAVLQFGFGDDRGASEHLPHHYRRHQVAYTGTHDNDTACGWYAGLDAATRDRVDRYLAPAADRIHDAMVRAVLASVAERAVVPMQDVLGLGSEARFNTPGSVGGNWRWRCRLEQLDDRLAERLRRLTELTGRSPASGPMAGART